MRLFREVQTLRVDEIQTEDSLEDDWTVLEVKGKESQVSLKQCPPQVPTVAPAPLAVRYKTEKPKQKVQPVMFNFNSLFKELQFAVIDQLPVDALCAAIQVCHNWQDIITNNDIWKSSYCRYFNPNSGGNSSFQRRSFEAIVLVANYGAWGKDFFNMVDKTPPFQTEFKTRFPLCLVLNGHADVGSLKKLFLWACLEEHVGLVKTMLDIEPNLATSTIAHRDFPLGANTFQTVPGQGTEEYFFLLDLFFLGTKVKCLALRHNIFKDFGAPSILDNPFSETIQDIIKQKNKSRLRRCLEF